MLTVRDAAEELRMAEPTVRAWIRAGRLPAQRVGSRKFLIERADLLKMIQPVPTPQVVKS